MHSLRACFPTSTILKLPISLSLDMITILQTSSPSIFLTEGVDGRRHGTQGRSPGATETPVERPEKRCGRYSSKKKRRIVKTRVAVRKSDEKITCLSSGTRWRRGFRFFRESSVRFVRVHAERMRYRPRQTFPCPCGTVQEPQKAFRPSHQSHYGYLPFRVGYLISQKV